MLMVHSKWIRVAYQPRGIVGIRAYTGGEPCGDTEGVQFCLGCFKRADVYVYCCKVILCDSSGEYLEIGYK